MYLKEIKTHGFKSFADHITIDLNNKITGIVGPNGSGKSNVVDAVRWVLGEQSIKSLRGDDAMTDVIFSGSKTRNALNVASVTLVFDNSDNYLPTPFTEVAIKRRVYADGTNEYFLNNEKCRLKDVTDLFLDSGVAKESFNIISQGKIEEIISNKPSERRIIFEEAAGVLKYKKRKDEALRKLDRTHINMQRIDDIINELGVQIEPLKEQHDKAIIYLEAKEELEKNEIALIAKDITSINARYQDAKLIMDKINNELISISTLNATNEAKVLEYKNKLNEMDELNSKLQKELLVLTKEVEQINSQKQIILERKKYEVDDTKFHQNLVFLKEEELKLKNAINNLGLEINNHQEYLNNLLDNIKLETNKLDSLKDNKIKLNNLLSNNIRLENTIKNNIDNLKDNIENNSTIPYAAKMVLANPKLNGINDVIGNVIDTSDKHLTAVTTAIGASSGYVITETEQAAKEAIKYLKSANLGRATFYPLNVIKPRGIEPDIASILKGSDGFVGIAIDLIKYDPKYYNVLSNQLGNVIVASDLDTANTISKKINYRYKIVTLDGELIHVGGSLTGGSFGKTRNILNDKFDLEKAIIEQRRINDVIKSNEEDINKADYEIKALEDRIYLINKEKINIEELFLAKHNQINGHNDRLLTISREISGTNNILNKKLSDEEEIVINSYYEVVGRHDAKQKEIENVLQKRTILNSELEDYTFSLKKENTLFLEKSKELSNLEIEINRLDVKLDNLINTLSETYNMTYENAASNYSLELEETKARTKVNELKRRIRELGVVNIGAKDEYERIKTRFDFLSKQKEDLFNAENTLLEIIKEMDVIMAREFEATFNIIKANFSETFKELFKGGFAELKLTDSNNLLETGIEIIASPPGKKLTSISLLSGGEKTFTAISLLFAILKSRPVPFCILDEAEAALDEVNVESFGEYLTKLKDKTQFILITHKKKTMEFVDTLYGITMQESGVSKLVSVKLENVK